MDYRDQTETRRGSLIDDVDKRIRELIQWAMLYASGAVNRGIFTE